MYLHRLTITGFKSFATKTSIDFERGITGVVGPNGSGKSNLADAIRWALGEQGRSKLRLSSSDEVVFAGSEKRAKASFAEVVLLFNNEDGAFPLDLTEVEISRRMYRSGETLYQLAGRAVRLSEIQALLAGAGIGASTYTVIGQGMIDTILLSSPAERKLFFVEAAGIRGPELGREAAMRKLAATDANLTRLRDIAAELAPQLTSLSNVDGNPEEIEELESRVIQLRGQVASANYFQYLENIDIAVFQIYSSSRQLHRLRHRLRELEMMRSLQEQADLASRANLLQISSELSTLELERDQAAADLTALSVAVSESQRKVLILKELKRSLDATSSELESAKNREIDLRTQISTNLDAAARAAKTVDKASRDVAAAGSELVAIRNGTSDGARDQYLDHALQLLKTLAIDLSSSEITIDQIRLMVHKAGRMLSHATRSGAAELLAELKSAQKHLESAMTKRETALEHQTNISITGRSLEIDLNHQVAEVKKLEEALSSLSSKVRSAESEISGQSDLETNRAAAEGKLKLITEKLEKQRGELSTLSDNSGNMESSSSFFAAIDQANSQMQSLFAMREEAHVQFVALRQDIASVTRLAANWGVEISDKAPAESLAKLTDSLARAESKLETRAEHRQEREAALRQVTDRTSQLETQIADLETAHEDLVHLVTELEVLIQARFSESFRALAEQFTIFFGRLFEGGHASLELTDTAEGGYGINIKASPKGKRLTSIAALSGGERALAGVALVAAIMKVNPSPFAVLDEIDAALDESNSGRLADILTEIEEFSQLIVITHNRQTMKSARVLFGVTMNEQNVSHIISMRLEQATRLAAR